MGFRLGPLHLGVGLAALRLAIKCGGSDARPLRIVLDVIDDVFEDLACLILVVIFRTPVSRQIISSLQNPKSKIVKFIKFLSIELAIDYSLYH